MSCKIKYIEERYRKEYPKLADKLSEIHTNVWRDVIASKLFTQKGTIPSESTYLYSKVGTEVNKKQIEFINKMTVKYGGKVITSKDTESGYNKKVIVGVNSIAQLEYDKLQKLTQGTLFQLNNDFQNNNQSLQEGLNWLKSVNPNVQPEIVQGRLNSNNKNITNQDIKYQLSKEQSDAIDSVFDENPELANAIYESSGFNDRLKTSLGEELEYKDPYAKNRIKDFKKYEVLNEDGNNIGTVVIENRGNKTVILHPELSIIGKGYGKDLYKSISSELGVTIQEWSESGISKSDSAKKMWDSLEKEGDAIRIFDEEQGDNFRQLTYKFEINSQQKQQVKKVYQQYINSLLTGETISNQAGDLSKSLVKDVVYHAGTINKNEKFKKELSASHSLGKGFYFASEDSAKEYQHTFAGDYVISAILNMKNPFKLYDLSKNERVSKQKEIQNSTKGFDSLLYKDTKLEKALKEPQAPDWIKKDANDEWVVFEPEQIHILGSKSDIEQAKEFISKQYNQKEKLNLAKIITNDLFNKKEQGSFTNNKHNTTKLSRSYIGELSKNFGYISSVNDKRYFNSEILDQEFTAINNNEQIYDKDFSEIYKDYNSERLSKKDLISYIATRFIQEYNTSPYYKRFINNESNRVNIINDKNNINHVFANELGIFINLNETLFNEFEKAYNNNVDLDLFIKLALFEEFIHVNSLKIGKDNGILPNVLENQRDIFKLNNILSKIYKTENINQIIHESIRINIQDHILNFITEDVLGKIKDKSIIQKIIDFIKKTLSISQTTDETLDYLLDNQNKDTIKNEILGEFPQLDLILPQESKCK